MSLAQGAVPGALRRQILALETDAWPGEPSDPPTWPPHDPALDPVYVLLVENGRVLSSLAILRKPLNHAHHGVAAGGISAMTTRRDARHRGHGRRLADAARHAMAGLDLDVGIFSCDRPLAAFYREAGWAPVVGAVLIGGTPATPLRSDQPGLDKIVMAAGLTPAGRALADDLPGAEIALYPGEIDRLW